MSRYHSKRVKIQESFPEEYEEHDKLRERIYRRANTIAHHIVNPMGPNMRCYIPDCVQKGECYKEERDELIKLHVADIDENLQLFRTYPGDFRRFLQEEPKHDLHGSNEVQRKEYLQGMFVRIRKDEPPEKPKPNPKKSELTKKGISSTIKRLVWNKNIGEEIGKAKCWCCKSTDITQSSFHCGHVVAESKGGQTQVNNLKPICQNCNSSMGTRDMNDFMKTLE
jgi:5-methylcytosine-specific restriction endonuclease McrA|uniref:HNH endonuclease 5 domain-containing protein n=1 Tax=viral metagenome TaxID=1070528 RepID=A0A6C0AI33_9ZZZZ